MKGTVFPLRLVVQPFLAADDTEAGRLENDVRPVQGCNGPTEPTKSHLAVEKGGTHPVAAELCLDDVTLERVN